MLYCVALVVFAGGFRIKAAITDGETAKQWLDDINSSAAKVYYETELASWAYASNLTHENQELAVRRNMEKAALQKEVAHNASLFDYDTISDARTKRLLNKAKDIGPNALADDTKLTKLKRLQVEIEDIFATGEVCGITSHDECLQIEPGLTQIMATSRNYSLLSDAWKGWRNSTGKQMKTKYSEYVELSNEGVRASGYNDTGEWWRNSYESANFQSDLENLLEKVHPLYEQLHFYVRRKLQALYKDHKFPNTGHIPAHLLGNMWAQQWNNIYDLVIPYPGKESVDVTPALREQNYTVERMFKTSEEFFTSLGLLPMPQEFWNGTIMKKPVGRDMVCHASAWDFFNGKDFRIKMCTEIKMEDLFTIHHEMGHIQYFLQYKHQPLWFRDGANAGFHEAVGDVLALSVMTPEHLNKIGLLQEVKKDAESDINFLMMQALEKVAFLPFGYLIDQWRWSVFSGETPPSKYNEKWWDLRCRLQGLSPPVERSEDDFDPGAKYHVPANVPYIRYFVSFIVQFQFHKALCQAANQTGPLHRCDIYQSKEAGKRLGDMLKLGSSVPWPVALENVTGQPHMDAAPLLEYFQPLTDWLKQQNSGAIVGWSKNCPKSEDALNTDEEWATDWMQNLEDLTMQLRHDFVVAWWNYETNMTDHNQMLMVNARANMSVLQSARQKANDFLWKNFSSDILKEQFKAIVSELDLDKQTSFQKKNSEMGEYITNMTNIFARAEVCLSDGRCLNRSPGLDSVMSHSRNYTVVLESWKGWRDQTGKKIRSSYPGFINASNAVSRMKGFNDTGEEFRSAYKMDNFEAKMKELWDKLSPLYRQLHTYVRRKLMGVYGKEQFPTSGQIPAHLLGNMLPMEWNDLYDLLEPYSNVSSVDVSPEMLAQNYTVKKIFQLSEEFYLSLGLNPMPDTFWNRSMLERPEGLTVECTPRAWSMQDDKDYRIRMCSLVNIHDFIVAHHEMGHIEYVMEYSGQPLLYRNGANPGFHEAIGDTMTLSSTSPKHLAKIGLMPHYNGSYEIDINFLLKTSLEKMGWLPLAYIVDKWRYGVFSGDIKKEEYNKRWWDLECLHHGLAPPVERTEEDFDPGAIYHIPANAQYYGYFVSQIHQFQFHKALCRAANHTGPLHQCDIYGSKEAGKLLREMLKQGSSKPWQSILESMTGQSEMDAEPFIEFFQPLIDWLEKQNAGERVGWDDQCSAEKYESAVTDWLSQYNLKAEKEYAMQGEAEWNYATNITEETQNALVQTSLKGAVFDKESAANASEFGWTNFKDERIRRLLRSIEDIGTNALKNETLLEQLSDITTEMEGIYSKGHVCIQQECMDLEPGLTELFATSRDYDKLLTAWKLWRDETGKKMKNLYQNFVSLSNTGVRELGYADTGEYWRLSSYETENFQEQVRNLLTQLQPLYLNLHTYVRRQLQDIYGAEKFPTTGHIPAHLLGNMWAQSWNNVENIMRPFPKKPAVDVTDTMRNSASIFTSNFTATQMFRLAEDFFVSLGLQKMPDTFWRDSMILKPTDRDVVCHASAWDFLNRKDYRIKMCTDVTMESLTTIHHEMGHIEYYLQYKDQPVPFRGGANPGFHEAVGDLIALSVSTPKHLRRIGLLADKTDDNETDINFLMSMALDKIAFLPFGYLMDQWRWSVFSGETTISQYNSKWWDLRCQYQGIASPVTRSEDDFDPGAKSHIPSNTPYIRYFVAFVVQFQFHKSLCQAAGHTGPLHKCDIYKSKEAGKILGDMLKLGSSKPWPEAMEKVTGQRKMDAQAMLEYFQPLIRWLEKVNKHERPGWTPSCPTDQDYPVKYVEHGSTVSPASSLPICSYLVFIFLSIHFFMSINRY
ncbi:hypothetical protein ScPMuIL_011774 [Solemya velum]